MSEAPDEDREQVSAEEDPPRFRFLGARIREQGSVRLAHVPLDNRLTVLYGLNGAGKTQLLTALAGALSGDRAVNGTISVYIQPLTTPCDSRAFSPMQAIFAHAKTYLQGEIPWEDCRFNLDELVLQFIRTYFGGPDATTYWASEERHRGMGRFALLLMSAYGYNYVNSEANDAEDAIDTQLGLFTPILEALNEQRFIWSLSGGRRRCGLGCAQDGQATSEWRSELADLLAARASDFGSPDGADTTGVWDALFDEYGTLVHFISWDSVINAALGGEAPPVWAADQVLDGEDPGLLPCLVVEEGELRQVPRTIAQLVDSLIAQRPTDPLQSAVDTLVQGPWPRPRTDRSAAWIPELLVEVDADSNSVRIHPAVEELRMSLSETAANLARDLLPRPIDLRCETRPLFDWGAEGPFRWIALDATGSALELSSLSAAERRWALFAIDLADALLVRKLHEDVFVVIDEPERALHRRAERSLAEALESIADTHDLRIVAASHSPAFLGRAEWAVLHVARSPEGWTNVEPVPGRVFERSRELGLDPSDLLQLSRCILLVEGQHELIILDELLGDELGALGVDMLCMRGATSLQAWDAQLLQRYTDIPIVVLVDNDRAERLEEIWTEARGAFARGEDHIRIIDRLKSGGQGAEGQFLRELCKNLITASDPDRYHVTAFEAPDIPEYLPVEAIAPMAAGKTWGGLRSEAGSKVAIFKKWMTSVYGADYSDATLRRAASSMDALPADFTKLLTFLSGVVRTHPRPSEEDN